MRLMCHRERREEPAPGATGNERSEDSRFARLIFGMRAVIFNAVLVEWERK